MNNQISQQTKYLAPTFTPELAVETFGEDSRQLICNNLEEYCFKWRVKEKQIEELKRIIPTLPIIEGPISLRGLYEVMLPKMQQELRVIERHIRRLQQCLELLEGKRLFADLKESKGQIDVKALKERLDITDVVSKWIDLKQSGKTFKGRCPFHNDHSPSFVVYPEDGHWWCFACNEGGDVISFVQRINNYSFREALAELEERL